ncbi:MAG: hypothetical protein CK424_05670 [Legionella sp.]|nr:MAG: hypothetical protein CK424_05670 [Legionella sp.]
MAGNNSEHALLPANSSSIPNNHFSLSSSFSWISFSATSVKDSAWRSAVAINDAVEAATDRMRSFIKPYHESGVAYRAYGVADGINLIFSLFNLWYLFKHAWQRSLDILTPNELTIALKEFHDAENTLEGFWSTLVLTLLWVAFSTIGSTFVEKQDYPFVKTAAFLLSHARTMLKQLKWTFKGLRALFALVLYYGVDQGLLVNLFFPLAAVIGIAAMVNSVILRVIRDTRKDKVKANCELNKQIIESKSLLHKVSVIPDSLEGYECSLILLESDTSTARNLYYIDAERQCIEMDLPENLDVEVEIEKQQTENIHARMKDHLHYLLKKPLQPENVLHFIDKNPNDLNLNGKYRNCYVYSSQTEGIEDCDRLCYINSDGDLEKVRIGEEYLSVQFHETFLRTQKNPDFLRLTAEQLTRIFELKPGQLRYDYNRFTAYRKQVQANIQVQDKNVAFFALFSASTSALFNGLYFYIYAGTSILTLLSPHMAILMLTATISLYVICVTTCLAEERDFQRRLEVTMLRPKIELSKKDTMMLYQQLELLLSIQRIKKSLSEEPKSQKLHQDLIQLEQQLDTDMLHHVLGDPSASDKAKWPLKKFFESPKNLLLSIERRTKKLSSIKHSYNEEALISSVLEKLRSSLADGKKLRDELKPKLQGSYWAVAFTGLQNGLGIQGAMASCAFMVSTLMYGAQCPPVFALTCMAMGITAVVLSCVQALVSYYYYRKKIEEDEAKLAQEFPEEALAKMTRDPEEGLTDNPEEDLADIRKSVHSSNEFSLESRSDYVAIEWAEIFRLFFSGWVKGNKAMIELYARFLDDPKKSYMPLIGSVLFAIALGSRAGAKGFGAGRPDDDKSDSKRMSSTPRARTFFDRPNTHFNVLEGASPRPSLGMAV